MKTNNLIMWLAGFLVVALGIMAYLTYGKSAPVDVQTTTLSKQSSSDELDTIESDVEATEFDNLDKELIDIENELNASY